MKKKEKINIPKHVAIIMDGNRRWAVQKGLNINDGHEAGARNLDEIINFLREEDNKLKMSNS